MIIKTFDKQKFIDAGWKFDTYANWYQSKYGKESKIPRINADVDVMFKSPRMEGFINTFLTEEYITEVYLLERELTAIRGEIFTKLMDFYEDIAKEASKKVERLTI